MKTSSLVVCFSVVVSSAAHTRAGGEDAKELAAYRVEQLSQRVLAAGEQAGEVPLLLGKELIREAVALAPEDVELSRVWVEYLRATGEEREAVKAALAGYLKTSPGDDAAQWAMVEMIVGESQTAGERITAYERMATGARAERLSAALRSRLTWRAAELRREQGETKKFYDLLARAIELDPSNAAAAETTYELFTRSDRVNELDRMQALLVWHKAVPTDPFVQLRIARTLLGCGQYEAAAAWYGTANDLLAYHNPLSPEQMVSMAGDWALSLWGAGRGKDAAGLLRSLAGGEGDLEKGGELPVGLRMVLAVIESMSDPRGEAASTGDEFGRLDAALSKVSEGETAGLMVDRLADQAWVYLLLDRPAGETERVVNVALAALPDDDAREMRIKGWWSLRSGKLAEARDALKGAAESDPAAALGLALCEDDGEQRAELLNELCAANRGGLMGAVAAEHLRRSGRKVVLSAGCETVARLAAQVPEDLKNIADPTVKFISLRVTMLEARSRFAEPVRVAVEVLNLSDLPLSVGDDGTVPVTVLLVPRVLVGKGEWRAMRPQVVDLGRVLRLMPGESVRVETRLSGADLDAALTEKPGEAVQMAVEAVLNPRMDRQGKFVPGLMGGRIVSRRVERLPSAAGATEVGVAIEKLRAMDGEAMLAAAWLIRSAAGLPAEQGELVERIAAAVKGYYDGCDAAGKAWVVSFIPATEVALQRFAAVIDAAVKSEELLVHEALLLSVADRADSPVLTAALRRDGGPVKRFAEGWREVLKSREQTEGKQGGAGEPAK